MIDIHQFPCRSDNYGVIVHEPGTRTTIAIDAPDANAVRNALDATGWTLTDILVTHHHGDHVEGIEPLKAEFGVTVTAPESEASRIPAVDRTVADGEMFQIGGIDIKAIRTPGHTLGQMSYWLPREGTAFTGDTLFALGCGRVFEGTMEQMWDSLLRLRELPEDTRIYCGHEYTLSNARFAVTVDPDNAELAARAREIERLRADNKPTLPTTLGLEIATNPFLRADVAEVQAAVGLAGADPAKVFSELRARKDRF